MPLPGCEVIGEIRYGSELSFEEVVEVEATLREKIEALLTQFDPVYVDIRSSGDELGFMSSLRECDSAGLYGACLELATWLDGGALGRLVAVSAGFGPVQVWTFSASGVNEASFGTR
jgi:hypothetical protein